MGDLKNSEYGFLIKFRGIVDNSDVEKIFDDVMIELKEKKSNYGVIVDMREMITFPLSAQHIFKDMQSILRNMGMKRSIIVLNDTITAMQFRNIGKSNGSYEWERYLDSSRYRNWHEISMLWLTEGKDPDKLN